MRQFSPQAAGGVGAGCARRVGAEYAAGSPKKEASPPRTRAGVICGSAMSGSAGLSSAAGRVRSVKGRDSPQRRLGGGQAAALPLCGGSAGRRRAGQTGVVLRVVKHLFARAAGVTLSARRCGAGWEVSLKWLTRLCVRGILSPSGVSLI